MGEIGNFVLLSLKSFHDFIEKSMNNLYQ